MFPLIQDRARIPRRRTTAAEQGNIPGLRLHRVQPERETAVMQNHRVLTVPARVRLIVQVVHIKENRQLLLREAAVIPEALTAAAAVHQALQVHQAPILLLQEVPAAVHPAPILHRPSAAEAAAEVHMAAAEEVPSAAEEAAEEVADINDQVKKNINI